MRHFDALKDVTTNILTNTRSKKDIQVELDVDPQRDDNASPMSSHRCMALSQVKIRTFWGEFSNL